MQLAISAIIPEELLVFRIKSLLNISYLSQISLDSSFKESPTLLLSLIIHGLNDTSSGESEAGAGCVAPFVLFYFVMSFNLCNVLHYRVNSITNISYLAMQTICGALLHTCSNQIKKIIRSIHYWLLRYKGNRK